MLVGLSLEETEFYMAHARAALSFGAKRGENYEAESDRYLALHDKHEQARFQVLGAEHYKRVDKPIIN